MAKRLDEFYTVKELLQLHEESARNEFKPKFGIGAERGSNENEKAVKDILKNAQALDNKGRTDKAARKPRVNFEDYNKTTLDVNFEVEPSKEWKDRVKKLVTSGTESDMADCYNTDGNESFYNARKEMSKNRNDRDTKERQKGIVGRNNTDHHAKDYENKTSFVNENKPTKRLKFKNTIFLSESQILSKVPEDYKVDENKFYMQDKTGTDYLIECKKDPFGFLHIDVSGSINKREINEEIEKIKKLSGYCYGDDNVKVDRTKIGDMSESIKNFRTLLTK